MGNNYRNDFYLTKNIIGYTGDINNFPTIYFYNRDSREYGHITQKHEYGNNIGREKVRSSDAYCFRNKDVEGTIRLIEIDHNRGLYHESRSIFTPVGQNEPEMRKLQTAIEWYSYKKGSERTKSKDTNCVLS